MIGYIIVFSIGSFFGLLITALCVASSRSNEQWERINFNKENDWIPFSLDYDEEEQREMLSCPLPDEDEEILVTYKNGYVGEDTFLRDGTEYYLDSNREFVTEAIAWMPKPQPYKGDM